MIIKKIESGAIRSKEEYVLNLAKYILDPHETDEKLLYAGFRGFLCSDIIGARAELVANAVDATTSAQPTLHLMLSFKEGEQPSNMQVDEAVLILMRELEMESHTALFGLHCNTANSHIHLELSRMDPISKKIVSPNKGFDILAIHRAIAKIEHAHGWESEKNGLYEVLSSGKLVQRKKLNSHRVQPRQRQRDMEHRTGEVSSQRIAIDVAGPIIRKIRSWGELHVALAVQGMRYVRQGSGAVVYVGDVAVKASTVDRNAAFKKLQKRLGAYVPADAGVAIIKQFGPQPIEPKSRKWNAYIGERKAYFSAKDDAKSKLKEQQDSERAQLLFAQRQCRKEILNGDWKKLGEARNAMRSLLAAQHAAEKAALKERHSEQRALHRQRYKAFPDFETWLRLQNDSELADAWRYRHSGNPSFIGPSSVVVAARDIRAFQASVYGDAVYYSKSQKHGVDVSASFIDRGGRIDICGRDDESLLAAMQLASQKWGPFEITGDHQFIQRCVALAAKHGIRLADPLLQTEVENERKQLHRDMRETFHLPQLKAVMDYTRSLQAHHYRVIASHPLGDNAVLPKFVSSNQGGGHDLTEDDLVAVLPRMLSESLGGCQLTIQPRFDKKMTLLVSDISDEKMKFLLSEGFHPSLVIEKLPGLYDILFITSKDELLYPDDAVDAWITFMKIKYGLHAHSDNDSGHLIPGFVFHTPKISGIAKPKHVVKIHASSECLCEKTKQMIISFDEKIVDKNESRNVILNDSVNQIVEHNPSTGESLNLESVAIQRTLDAMKIHAFDFLSRHGKKRIDQSRIDAQVALRLRLTGHQREDVEAAMEFFAPTIGGEKLRSDWAIYARKAADFAWGPAGQRQVEMMQPNIDLARWLALESELVSKRPRLRI